MALQQLKALIFDLDGTLVDSEPNYFKGDRDFIESYGGQYTEKDHQDFIGKGSLALIERLKENLGVQKAVPSLLEEKDRFYRKYARENTAVFPEMEKILKVGESLNLPMAVASGSSSEVIAEILEITGLKRYFQLTVSSEEVEKGKPEPHVFLETARRLNVKPEECLVFEDSLYGLLSGHRAGMKVVFIPSVVKKDHGPYLAADCYYEEGMPQFSVAHCWSWVRKNFCV
ncbi:MAG: HAD family phosphatase [Spirochaetales bacterium]|nr:HAD family phosphatase [Spirochaetales bacterium]